MSTKHSACFDASSQYPHRIMILRKRRSLYPLVLLIFLWEVHSTFALLPGDENWDDAFGSPGANGPVSAISVLGEDVYFGGEFTSISGLAANSIARWDGRRWNSLGSGLNGPVFAVATSPDYIYAAGQFAEAGGIPATNIARWDGTNWSALGAGISGKISALALVGA